MKRWLRILLILIGIGIVTGGIIVYKIYTKPHRDVTKEEGVQLSAQSLYDAFKANEADANTKYLDKAIQLTGEVGAVSKNQDGNTVVDFKTNDPLVVINCTFKTDPGSLQPGQTITFKGICTGYIPDANVVINEGVLVK
jgi:cytochrome c-type biogenesis protein CcmE